MAGRRKCRITGCGESLAVHSLCEGHWDALPDDLQHRIIWAREESSVEREAALRAAAQYLNGE